MDKTKNICVALWGIVSILVVGEMFGNAISKPIAMVKTKNNINVEALASLIDVMNQRICDLEDKIKEEEA